MAELTAAREMVENENTGDGANYDDDGRAGGGEENRKLPSVAQAPPVTHDREDETHGYIGWKGVDSGDGG